MQQSVGYIHDTVKVLLKGNAMNSYRITGSLILLITFILTPLPACLAQEIPVDSCWWQSDNAAWLYFDELEKAEGETFEYDFEYPFKLILSDNTLENYEKLDSVSEKKKFITGYVRQVDENPLLPFNYWLNEFIKRFRHAKNEFSQKKKPYIDARGEYYIKYGEPTNRFMAKASSLSSKFVRDMSTLSPWNNFKAAIDAYVTINANESWYYSNEKNHFIVHFEKRNTWREIDRLDRLLRSQRKTTVNLYWPLLVKERMDLCPYYSFLTEEIYHIEEMVTSTVLNYNPRIVNGETTTVFGDKSYYQNYFRGFDNKRWQAESVENYYMRTFSEPNVSSIMSELSTINFISDIAQFKGSNGGTRLSLTVKTPVEEFFEDADVPNTKYLTDEIRLNETDTLNVTMEFMLRDSTFTPLVQAPVSNRIERNSLRKYGIPNLMGNFSFAVLPGNGDITVQVRETEMLKYGFRKLPVSVRDFSGDSLMVSDIELFFESASEEVNSLMPTVQVEDMTVIPYPFVNVRKVLPMYCYFELYNLDMSGQGRFFNLNISSKHIEKSFLKKIGKWLIGRKEYEIGIIYNRQAHANDSAELIGLDLSKMGSGQHILTVSVIDPLTDKVLASSSKTLVISK